jgi:hypothetical protein
VDLAQKQLDGVPADKVPEVKEAVRLKELHLFRRYFF